MHALFTHLKPHQWYKNLLIFLPLIFSGQLASASSTLYLSYTCFGFILLCIVSSGNYCLNDFFDWRRDTYNKEKKQRLSKTNLLFLGIVLIALSLLLCFIFFNLIFFFLLFLLFLLTLLYSSYLKHIAFADVLLIATNFVLRAVAGAYIFLVGSDPYIWISPWLITCTFFLALFLAVGKRYVEYTLFSEKFRPVLRYYTPDVSNALLIITSACLIMSYTLYSFLGQENLMIFTLPFAVFTIFRYLHLVYTTSEIAYKPHKIVFQKEIMVAISLWILLSFVFIYWI